jgi:hypothetical protein
MRDQQIFYLDMRRSQEELGKTRGPAFLCREQRNISKEKAAGAAFSLVDGPHEVHAQGRM